MHVIGNKLRRVSRECDAQIYEYKIIINGASEAHIRTLTNGYQGLTFKPTKRVPDENSGRQEDSCGTVSHKLNPQIQSLKDD